MASLFRRNEAKNPIRKRYQNENPNIMTPANPLSGKK
jgi:hypothetical protein